MTRSIYALGRRMLSARKKGQLTGWLYRSGIKPSVSMKKSPFKLGQLLLTADFEMAWAFRFSRSQNQFALVKGLSERDNLPIILSLMEEFKIPVTWATVGHLFLDRCVRVDNKAHPEMPRPAYFENRNWVFKDSDWYQHDPCTDFKQDPAWYAPDLIDSILESDVHHEIACHTFSHIDFSDINCAVDLAEAEIHRCMQLARAKGIELKSMVFPGGTEGNLETLKKSGFTCYRKVMRKNITLPYLDRLGLVAIPSSWGLDRAAYDWSVEQYLAIADKYLAKAIEHKMVCHFWFHPSMDPWYLKNVLPKILERAAEHKKNGDLEIVTMKQLADKFGKQ